MMSKLGSMADFVSRPRMKASNTGSLGILSGLTTSTEHPSAVRGMGTTKGYVRFFGDRLHPY